MSYFARCQGLESDVLISLKRKLKSLDIKFGGAAPVPKRISVPTHADSKFMAEQALGDWAEKRFAEALDGSSDVKAIHYGFSSKTMAGDAEFPEEYRAGVRDTCDFGKRPDLLIVPRSESVESDISSIPTVDTHRIVAKSLGAIEVRSSRLMALKYIEHQRLLTEGGRKRINLEPNFTVKVEDLVKVYRWIEVFDRPQAYAQVFLDTVYGVSVAEIFQYIAQCEKLKIENPKRSGKSTVMIPLSVGKRIGTVTVYPKFCVEDRETPNGRHDIYARPCQGRIELDEAATLSLLS